MNVSVQEKLMYSVMKAIYDSGIPMNFKGSMVLKACLFEAGYIDETRHTLDIDANWCSSAPPSAEQMEDSLRKALRGHGIDLDVKLYRMYGEKRSAGFEFFDPSLKDALFTMDVDVGKPISKTKIYEIDGVNFCGVVPTQMIADKIATISTDNVFRRIKDVVDLYYISKVFSFDKKEILKTMESDGRTLGAFNGFLHRLDDLRHSYEKFRFAGNAEKPPFDVIYLAVKTYLLDLLPRSK